jgi:hypothetical protein
LRSANGKGLGGVGYRKEIMVYYVSTKSTQPPAVDFDLKDPLAPVYMAALMLGPAETAFLREVFWGIRCCRGLP